MRSDVGVETAVAATGARRTKLDTLAEFAVILLLVALACFLISS